MVNELYGFHIGQTRESVKEKLGSPAFKDVFEDGFEYEVFFLHPDSSAYLFFEYAVGYLDIVWSIQVYGTDPNLPVGFKELKMGIDKSQVEKKIGKPDEVVDVGKYGVRWEYERRNYSFEINPEGKLTSIKIKDKMPGTQEADDVINQMPEEVQSVFDYILHTEFLELFIDSSYSMSIRPVDFCVVDIDGDGLTEVFLLTYPHFAQTAPIYVYQIQADGSVIRLKESLAPGKIASRTNEYMDAHAGFSGMDMSIGPKADKDRKKALRESCMQNGMNVIEFPNFFHTDIRLDNGGGYVDLSLSGYKGKDNSCASVQPATPLGIVSGNLEGKDGRFFAVAVDKEIWIYQINTIHPQQVFDKKVSIIKLPKDFTAFKPEETFISYVDDKGVIKKIKTP